MTLKNIFEFNLIQTDKFTLEIIDLREMFIYVPMYRVNLSF